MGTPPKSHKEMLVSFTLGTEELKLVENVYKRLTSDENMMKCLRGKTQNPNESLHQRIWLYCPKHLTPSKMRLDFAAAQAVAHYNAGYEVSALNEMLGLPYTKLLSTHLKAFDQMMNVPIKRKLKNKKLQREIFYSAGAF